jgi:hypothetical protein
MTSGARELFLPDHRWLDDGALLTLPARGPFTPLTLFVCTFVTELQNLHTDFVALTRDLCAGPRGCLLAINSNFGHAAQPGYEKYLKAPKAAPERQVPTRGRARKMQGDGTCFNSAVEPVIAIDHPGIPDDKVYKVKCFPSTGETQVPGVICADLSDGEPVLESFTAYLNELGVGDLEEGEVPGGTDGRPPRRKMVLYTGGKPTMMYYKFRLIRNSPRILVSLYSLAAYLLHLEAFKVVEGKPLTEAQAMRFTGWPAILAPPFPVRETKLPTDDVKVSFRFEGATRSPRVNIFQEGKVNILGAESERTAELIYDYLVGLFTANWSMLVVLKPYRDAERRAAARAPLRPVALVAVARPAVRLTDGELDSFLEETLGYTLPGFVVEAEAEAEAGPGQNGEGGAEPVPDDVVNAIVDDLADWGFEEGDEDFDDEDAEDAGGGAGAIRLDMTATLAAARFVFKGENGDLVLPLQVGRPWPSPGLMLRVQAAGSLEDPVLDQVDGEDVEDDEEDPL